MHLSNCAGEKALKKRIIELKMKDTISKKSNCQTWVV